MCGLKDTLLLTDKTGQQWVTLGKCGNTKPENTPYEKLQIYYWLYGYFMTTDQEDEFKKCAEKGLSIISSDISYPNQTYVVFNREYPWAPSCEAVKEYSWKKAEIFTGEYHHEEIVNGINTSFLVEWLNSQKSETEEEQKEEDAVSIAVQDALVDDEITKLWQDGEADAVPNSGSKTIRSVLVKKDVEPTDSSEFADCLPIIQSRVYSNCISFSCSCRIICGL